MATQPTNLPVPSESPRDLKFNAGKIDEFVTSFALSYIDRFGDEHYTIEGLRWLAQRAIAEFGWIPIGTFQIGAVITLPNQILKDENDGEYYRWDGPLPKVVEPNSTPDSTGGVGVEKWLSVGDAVLRGELNSPGEPLVDPTRVGVKPSGNLSQALYYVTPEQFGAIGDGTLHLLSEKYTTLTDAQLVYPLATSLSQSIDWAAMQKADTVARSLKCSVRCPALKKYRFSSIDTLMLDIDSCFIGGPQSDHFHGTMISKDKPIATSSTNIGDICIVKVKKSSDTASTNGFVNGVVFQGFSLEWANVAWMSAVKGDLSICLHMNDAIKAKVDVSVWGGEFGVYGYGCWGMVGTLRVLSCHKGIYFDPVSPTPEHTVPVGVTGSTTSFDLRVEIGGCPFPIYLDKCQYGFFRGYVEVLNSTEGAIWDSASETPIAVQLGSNCEYLTFELGVEFYNGLLLLADQNNKNITANFGFVYRITYMNSSGNHTARYTIANKYSQTEVTIPAATRAIFSFNNTGNEITVNGMNMSASANSFNNLESVDKYLYSALSGNRLFFNGGNVVCTNYLKVSRTNKRVIDFYRNNGLADALKPGSGWYYVGNGFYEQNTWTTAALDANGVVWVASPAGFNLHKCEAYSVGAGGLSQGLGLLEVPSATLMKFILQGGNATRGIVYKSTVELIN
ncbi:hypothetical protein [Enterobacter ludwigii]|uniref:tail fiber/spike domain-containing protein n=1 Tax=Enterobacter ludwigii TaxID=299767 RepID=UPI002FD54BC4